MPWPCRAEWDQFRYGEISNDLPRTFGAQGVGDAARSLTILISSETPGLRGVGPLYLRIFRLIPSKIGREEPVVITNNVNISLVRNRKVIVRKPGEMQSMNFS